MPITALVHIQNTEPIMGEIDDLPNPTDILLKLSHPRRMDGKDVNFIMEGVETVIFPVDKISFIEIVPTGEEDEIIGFVRE
jgi:hypothetical protein